MKVSIVTVSYNSAAFICDCLDSVKIQSYQDIEHVVIDGMSTDGTLDLLEARREQLGILVSERDDGIYDAMNKGLALSSGEIVGILNSDDFYLGADVISDVVECFEKCPSIDLVLGNVDFVNPSDLLKPIRFYASNKFKPWKMYFGFMPPHPAVFVRRSAYNKVGAYKLGYEIGADFEWFVRAFLEFNLSFKTICKTLVRMRVGGISTSGLKSNWIASKEMYRALSENDRNSFGFVLLRLPVKIFQLLIFKLKFLTDGVPTR